MSGFVRSRSRIAVRFLFVALWLVVASTGPQATPSTGVVISQVYGGGGNSGAPLRNDFVELFNRGASPVSLAGLSIQYTSATGTGLFSQNVTTLPAATIAPGQYFLVQLASQAAVGAPLPAPDVTGTINMSGTGGKVALISGAGLMCNGSSTACTPAQLAQIVDLVGWDGANFFETAAAPATTNTTAIFRKANGCSETDDNGQDFETGAPAPRNSASPPAPCLFDTPPAVSSTVPSNGAAGVALAAALSVTFSEPVTLSPGALELSCGLSGVHVVSVTGGPSTFALQHATPFQSSETCTLTIRAANVVDQDGAPTAMTGDAVVSFSTIEACGDPATFIHTIQGSGAASPLSGASVAIEGVVTADYQGAGQLGGYYVQEEDADGDGDPATSEGIFVFNTAVPVAVGDKVRVRGTVLEFQSSGTLLTELTSVNAVLVCASGNALPAVSTVTLPVPSLDAWEAVEGMLVTIPQTVTVSETFTLARFGEVLLSAGGRLPQPTNVVAPGAAAIARQALNDRSQILLDDANNQQNIDPTRYPQNGLSAANTLRVGDRLNGLTGVLEQRFGVYRVQPVGAIAFDKENQRPEAPASTGETLRVASFNVLNYFNGDGSGGGFPTERGATTAIEFARQRAKTIAAIVAMNADIVGLMELENDAAPNSAIEDLVAGLNAATAPGTYAFIDTGIVGTDAIRVALLYKPSVAVPFNTFAILDSSVNPSFVDTLNRPSLAQTFTQISNGERLTVVVNHLKSKGSDCDDAGDPDTGDGQGNCNVTRTNAAAALVHWLAGDPTGAGDPDVLLLGDMNSYAKEDPITAIKAAGYVDLIAERLGASGYSYVFGGQSGYLDHALAAGVLAPRVTGVAEWHINADEPVALDYNVEFKTGNQVNSFYAADPYRSSDHDPVVVGINLIQPFAWSGFFSPVGASNTAHAGSAVPLKFGLGGDRGLAIFAPGSPSSAQVPCEGGAPGAYEATVNPGHSTLSYDAAAERYTYVWKTQKSWTGTCRQLLVTLADGTSHSAMFAFTK